MEENAASIRENSLSFTELMVVLNEEEGCEEGWEGCEEGCDEGCDVLCEACEEECEEQGKKRVRTVQAMLEKHDAGELLKAAGYQLKQLPEPRVIPLGKRKSRKLFPILDSSPEEGVKGTLVVFLGVLILLELKTLENGYEYQASAMKDQELFRSGWFTRANTSIKNLPILPDTKNESTVKWFHCRNYCVTE